MADTYYSLTVEVPETDAELVQSLLHDANASGLELRDGETPPMPGVARAAPGEVMVIAFFSERADAELGQQWVREKHPGARLLLEEKEDQDWSTAWKALIRSVQVGRLWVGPPWETPPADKVAIVVEPKMAFGTGDHPTTSLCLEAVDQYLASHPGATVLDVGTGTGVLAIAAQRLGASRAVGIDNDPVAIPIAQECAQENGAPAVELSTKNLEEISDSFDLVLANILANTLIELAPAIASHCKDQLVLAGVLTHQQEEVEAAYLAQGLEALPAKIQGEWIRLMFRRRENP